MDTTDLNPAPRNSYAGAFESLIEATNTFKNYHPILLTGATFLSAAGVAGLFAVMAGGMGGAIVAG